MGNKKIRYAVDMDLYVYANNLEEATKEAKKIAKTIDEIGYLANDDFTYEYNEFLNRNHDNKCRVVKVIIA